MIAFFKIVNTLLILILSSASGYGDNWILSSLAPNASWRAVTCDSTGIYLAAAQQTDAQGNRGYIYISSTGKHNYIHNLHTS